MSSEIVFSQSVIAAIGIENIYVFVGITFLVIFGWIFLVRYKYAYIRPRLGKWMLSCIIFTPIAWNADVQTVLASPIFFFMPVFIVGIYDFITLRSDTPQKNFSKKIKINEQPFDRTTAMAAIALIFTSLFIVTSVVSYSNIFSEDEQTKAALLIGKNENTQSKNVWLSFYDGESIFHFPIPSEHASKFEQYTCYSLSYYPSPTPETDLNMFITEIVQNIPCPISIEGN